MLSIERTGYTVTPSLSVWGVVLKGTEHFVIDWMVEGTKNLNNFI